MRHLKWVSLAVKEAEKSLHIQRVGAVVFNKKQFISSGHNYPNRSIARSHNPRFRRWPTSIHAEIDAITKARCDLKGSSIIIIRINKKGQLRLAKPCRHCMSYLNHIGIKNVYYSISKYPYVEKLKR